MSPTEDRAYAENYLREALASEAHKRGITVRRIVFEDITDHGDKAIIAVVVPYYS